MGLFLATAATSPHLLRLGGAFAFFFVIGCEQEYAIAPTFCDDWCRVTQQVDCESPSDCVRNCSFERQWAGCHSEQGRLLECYQARRAEDFSCSVQENFFGVTVELGVCEQERDAVLECQQPGISQCLGLCRQVQQEQLATVVSASTGLTDLSKLNDGDAGANQCPLLDQPCENICLTVTALQASVEGECNSPSQCTGEAGEFDGDTAADDETTREGELDAGGGAAPALQGAACVNATFLRCFNLEAAEALGLPLASSEMGSSVVGINEALAGCIFPF